MNTAEIQKSTYISALSIIKNNGNCNTVSCLDCRLCTIYAKEILDVITHTMSKDTKKWAVQWLIDTYGKERTKELIVEALL